MKKIIKGIGLITLIIFTFFYTDKVLKVVREEDSIMMKINDIKDKLTIEPTDAIIIEDTIIPGLNGKKVNIDKSYKKMKNYGNFNKNNIIYDIIYPNISITNNKDKYIIQGNMKKNTISIIFILDNDKYLNELQNIINGKDIKVNYFIDYSYLINNTTKIKEMSIHELYSYGDEGEYTPDNLLFSNNLISRIGNNEANICLSINNNKVINLCSKNNLYTIKPTIIIKKSPYITIKKNLFNGSIILFYINNDLTKELKLIIDYINSKGLKIVGLSELLSEDID